MNILPLMAAFSILFSAGIYAFFHESQSLAQERYHVFGALDIDRQIGNKQRKAQYKATKGEAVVHKSGTGQSSPTKKLPPRSPTLIYPTQKLNIRKLGQPNSSLKLRETALSLIKNLYKATPLYTPGMEEKVLETLVTLMAEHPDASHLEALLLYIPQDRTSLFYKLFKGTQNTGGYPALTDYVQLGGKNEKPIHLRRASEPLILALLGPKTGQELLEKEKAQFEETHKSSTLTKAEWETFFLKHQLNPADFDDLVDYSNNKGGAPQRCLRAKKQQVQIKTASTK